jgi:hypothetical protein
LFEYDGIPDENSVICLAMYDSDNSLVAGKNPTIKFDNENPLSTNRLQLTVEMPDGDVDADGKFTVSDAIALRKWMLAVSDAKLVDRKAGDLNNNNRIDVLDLCLMKKKLLDLTAYDE